MFNFFFVWPKGKQNFGAFWLNLDFWFVGSFDRVSFQRRFELIICVREKMLSMKFCTL